MNVPRRYDRVEWPTLALILLTYLVWAATLYLADVVTLVLAVPLLSVTLTMHSSLQHEAIHGHPLPVRQLSAALMWPGLGLFIPYGRFRDLHLAHHRDAKLTDPLDDPESYYFDPPVFARFPRAIRLVLEVNNTLAGRLVLGPLVGTEAFLRTEVRRMWRGERAVIRDWAIHAATLVPVLWCVGASAMPVWAYVLAAYGALSILKIRTFAEHQAHARASGRSVIIEDRGPLALLFLNNNLHAVHHSQPGVAWYDLPALYRERRDHYLRRNRGYRFASYASLFRLYFRRAKEPVPHPLRTPR